MTFHLDGKHVQVEMIVPYVPPAPQPSKDPNKIPLAIAEGFPVPLVARHRLPPFSSVDPVCYLRTLVQESYLHEIDEQLRIGQARPFAGALHKTTDDE